MFVAAFIFITIHVCQLSATNIPFIIWSTSNNALDGLNDDSKFSSELTASKLVKETSNKNVVVFLQKQLSFEDISKFGDVYNIDGQGGILKNLKKYSENYNSRHVLLSSKGFADQIHAFGKGVDEGWKKVFTVHIDKKTVAEIDQELREISKEMHKPGKHLIIIHLSNNDAAGMKFNDLIIGAAMKNFLGSGAVTAVLTAEESSSVLLEEETPVPVDSGSELRFEKRHLLAVEDKEVQNGTFVNVTGNLFAYFKTVAVRQEDSKGKEMFNVISNNDLKVSYAGSVASKNDTAALLKLSLTVLPAPIKSLTLTLNFNLTNSVWFLSRSKISLTCDNTKNCTAMTDRPIEANWMTAPLGFSYHCTDGQPIDTKDENNTASLSITFAGFQIQPFGITNDKFGAPNDCVGFFTIPIWSGLFTTLILLLILAYGVGMLASVQTMDRFDDAKGKAIQVNTAE